MISKASVGRWRAELFTTDYVEKSGDTLLLEEFEGHVNVMPASAQQVIGGAMRALHIFRAYEVQLLRGVTPDLMHIHGVWSPLLAAFAFSAIRNGIPYIVAPHGMLEPWPLLQRSLRKRLALRTYQGQVLRNAIGIHATSTQEAENLRRLPYVRGPIYIVPNAVDEPPEHFRYEDTALAGHAEAPPKKMLLFLSRLHVKKGLELLLQAWAELRPDDWDLAIVGGGAPEYIAHIKRLCNRDQISNVQLYPPVDGEQREAMFRRASALVLPTYSENFGNVVAEAMLRGLPVVTTTGTPWSVLRELRCGWYVEPTLPALKAALGELCATHPALLREMGQRGKGYAEAFCSVEAVHQRLWTMYTSALARAFPERWPLATGQTEEESLPGWNTSDSADSSQAKAAVHDA